MICLVEDWYLKERPRWVATLTNGEVVYGDDDRPGVEPPSSWLRLKAYCLEQGEGISKMHFNFRSNVVHLPSDQEGYFFVRTACGVDGGAYFDGARIGYVVAREVHTAHYKVPEMQLLDREIRPLDPASDCVILRPPNRQPRANPDDHPEL